MAAEAVPARIDGNTGTPASANWRDVSSEGANGCGTRHHAIR